MNSAPLTRMSRGAAPFLALLVGLLLPALARAGDALPSWNDGAAKAAIVAFVTRVTAEGGAGFRAGGRADRDLRQ